MKAIILAAGRGSRMGVRTNDSPKCLTVLAGQTLLQWQIDALTAAGIDRMAVVTGYLADKIEAPEAGRFHNPRWQTTNMVMSLACASDWLEEDDCVVSYSDIVYRPDAVRRLRRARGDIALTYDRHWLALWSERFEDPLDDAETFRTDAAGRLVEIGRRASCVDDIKGQYMGLLKFTPTGWRQVERTLDALSPADRDRLDMTALLGRLIEAGVAVDTVAVDGGWCEVDTEADLARYAARIAAQPRGDGQWSHDWREGHGAGGPTARAAGSGLAPAVDVERKTAGDVCAHADQPGRPNFETEIRQDRGATSLKSSDTDKLKRQSIGAHQ